MHRAAGEPVGIAIATPGRASLVGRTTLAYVALLGGLRVLGKRDLSQLTPFDAILLLLITQLFRNYLVGQDDTLLTAVVASTTLLVLGVGARWTCE